MIISWPLVKYVLTAAMRDKLLLSLTLMIVVATSLSVFLGSAAISEKQQFSVVFSSGSLRIISVLGLVLFIVFYIRRSFDSRDVDYLLTRPLDRTTFIISHALSLSVLAAIFGGLVFAALCVIGAENIHQGYYLWGVSLIFELIIVANAALFFSMVLPNASASALSVFAFYVLARLIGQLLGISSSGLLANSIYDNLGGIMEAISLVVPRLDLMTQTSWLVYGGESGNVGYAFLILQGVLYGTLLMLASLIDLKRRQF